MERETKGYKFRLSLSDNGSTIQANIRVKVVEQREKKDYIKKDLKGLEVVEKSVVDVVEGIDPKTLEKVKGKAVKTRRIPFNEKGEIVPKENITYYDGKKKIARFEKSEGLKVVGFLPSDTLGDYIPLKTYLVYHADTIDISPLKQLYELLEEKDQMAVVPIVFVKGFTQYVGIIRITDTRHLVMLITQKKLELPAELAIPTKDEKIVKLEQPEGLKLLNEMVA